MKHVIVRFVTAAALATPLTAVASTVEAADAPFACDQGFYQVIAGQLAEFDPGTGYYANLGVDQPNYNALGYRIADGLAYGIRSNLLLRIDANGTVTELGTLDIVPGAYTGAFGDDGLLHVSRGGNDWYAVDVDTLAATRIEALSQSRSVADIANVSGVFYGISSRGELWKFDLSAGSVTSGGQVGGLPSSSKAYGAAWSTAGGNLYVGRNSGEIYQITGYSTGAPQATQVATATATNSNDGMSCPLAAPPAGIADVDGPTPEVPPSTPEAEQAAAAYAESYQEPQYAVQDAGIGSGAACEATVDEDRLARVGIDPLTVSETTVLYGNDFVANADGWYVASGSWLVQDGGYQQLNTCGFDYTALLPGYHVGSFDLDVVFRSVEGVNQGGVVINQSSVDTRSGAMLIDLADDGATLRWGVYDSAGYYENLGWDLIPAPTPGEPVTFHIEVRETDVTIFHNGNNVITVQAPNPGGLVGLVASQSVVAFDTVTLAAVPAS